jgi:hypothetical protein
MLYWIVSEVKLIYNNNHPLNNSRKRKSHAPGMLNKKRKKIIVIGDSLAWGCTSATANLMENSYEVTST